VIDNEWDDTPGEAIDFYLLRASITDRPKGLQVTEYKDCWSYKADHMSLSIGVKDGIQRLAVLEYSCVGDTEKVRYDAAVHIELQSGKQILLEREESILGFINIATDPEVIATDIKGLRERFAFPD